MAHMCTHRCAPLARSARQLCALLTLVNIGILFLTSRLQISGSWSEPPTRLSAAAVGPGDAPQHVDVSQSRFGGSTPRAARQRPPAYFWPGQVSNRWAPAVQTSCTHLMHSLAAPCSFRDRADVIQAVELVYPDFSLGIPFFPDERYRRKWVTSALLHPKNTHARTKLLERAWVPTSFNEAKRMYYTSNHGQVIISADTWVPSESPLSVWGPDTCGSGNKQSWRYLRPASSVSKGNTRRTVDRLLYAKSADAYSFQHFLDRASPAIVQSMPFLTDNWGASEIPYDVLGSPTQRELWQLYGFDVSRVKDAPVIGRRVVFGCDVPPQHPFIVQRQAELFLMGARRKLNVSGHARREIVPLGQRKVVLYCSRSLPGARALNGGRNVINEKDLLVAVRQMLHDRGLNETLVLHTDLKFRSKAEEVNWMNQNIQALVSPHGGALYNMLWLAPRSLVLELMPQSNPHFSFWEMAAMLNHSYWTLLFRDDAQENFRVSVGDVVRLLQTNLGKPGNTQLHGFYKRGK